MKADVTEGQEFKAVDFREEPPAGEYVDCVFVNCRLSETDLSGLNFDGCRFEGCDLSLVRLKDTGLREAVFVNCKLLGVRFEYCNPFGLSFSFSGCNLNLSSFFRLKIRKTRFENCMMHETDLAEADLAESTFDGCDLSGATFDHTNLEKADFRSAENYLIHPETNRIRKAKFSLAGLPGLLAGYGIEIE